MTEIETEAASKAVEPIPPRALSSLYDVACLYVACDTYDRFTSDYIDWELSSEALRAMSPEEISDLFDPETDNSLIAARVDLSGDEPKLGNPPVTIENLTEELKYKIGFMSRDKTARATDYSISNHSNGDDIETLAHDEWGNRFLRARFERWPFEVPEEVVEDSLILQDLRELGDDEAAMDRLENGLLEIADFDETEAIVTVKVRQHEDEDYRYPGEVSELNRAGVRRRYDHLRDGLSVDDAHGHGVGYVSNEEGEVLGGSSGIRGQYSKRHVERFFNLQGDDAWLSRPLKESQALAISKFDSIVDSFSFTRHGVRLHYLPYPTEPIDESIFKRFYTDVYTPLKQAEGTDFVRELIDIYTAEVEPADQETTTDTGPLADLVGDETEYEQFEVSDSWLRLYGLMYVGSTDPARVFVDEPTIDLTALTSLDDAYTTVLADIGASSLFGRLAKGVQYYLPIESGLVYAVMFGTFFDDVTSSSPDVGDEADANQYATADDALFTRYAKILRGVPLATRPLIEEYVTLIEKEFRSNQQEDRGFPTTAVVSQYVQLQTLDEANLLDGQTIINTGIAGNSMAASDGKKEYNTRDERLQAFIDQHDMLDNDEARSVFLLGALVGRVAAYQYSENISQKLTEQYPPSAVNRRSLPDITQDVLDRTFTYGDKDDIQRFNQRYTNRLTGSMLSKHPEDWELSESETKWIYALGIAYGKQDTSAGIDYDENPGEESDTE